MDSLLFVDDHSDMVVFNSCEAPGESVHSIGSGSEDDVPHFEFANNFIPTSELLLGDVLVQDVVVGVRLGTEDLE